jgi:hypothetical protein
MKSTPNKGNEMTAYETLLQQITDTRKLQYNAVMMQITDGTVGRLDAILEDLYRKQAKMNQGR